MDDVRAAVRELHAPHEGLFGLRCDGCSVAGWEAEQPHWPCATAALVYDDAERAEILEAWHLFETWSETPRNPSLAPAPSIIDCLPVFSTSRSGVRYVQGADLGIVHDRTLD